MTQLKILIAECKQEVSSFNPVASHYSDFLVRRGEEILAYHRTARNEIAGARDVFAARGNVELVPTYSALAITSGGTLARADFEQLAHDFLEAIRAAPPVDAVYFSLHGAMSAEGEDDPEGYLLQETRKILGERIPIVASFDLHGILTERILQHCNAITVYHTYPHIDFYETGERAAQVLLKIIDGHANPVTAKIFVPALVRGDELITQTGLIRHVVQAAQAAERLPGGLAAAMFWGNPFTDVAALGSNSVVITDGDAALAEREARRIADVFWQHHERMQVPLTSVADAVAQAQKQVGQGTTVLVDAADATSSGASGDSNVLLRALIEAGYRGRALVPIVDEPAVNQAFAAGIGATVNVTLGGALDARRFEPLPVQAKVRLLSDGYFRSESFGEQWYAGNTAVLDIGAMTVVATSRAVSLYDRSLFYAHGQDPRKFDAVVVKSPHCQPHMFKAWAGCYIDVDADGATSANLRRLGHTRCPRPMFPLDPEVRFEPVVQIFRR